MYSKEAERDIYDDFKLKKELIHCIVPTLDVRI